MDGEETLLYDATAPDLAPDLAETMSQRHCAQHKQQQEQLGGWVRCCREVGTGGSQAVHTASSNSASSC
jgi:hypothetical protein